MNTLDISSIGAACGKNPFESRDKVLLFSLCKKYRSVYKDILYKESVICNNDVKTYDTELKKIYKVHKTQVSSPRDINTTKEIVIEKMKKENTNMTKQDISYASTFLDNSLKKDCGTNNEPKVIKHKRYKTGNNELHVYSEGNWQIRGLHDATDDDMIIEIKTRMSRRNVRKNEYDLYQLFGYLLSMAKTKGKIVQHFDKTVFDSDLETDIEYGIVDIDKDEWRSKFKIFMKELRQFFIELDNYNKTSTFDIWKVFNRTELPIAVYDQNGTSHNVNPKYEKIIKTLGN